MGSSYSIPPFKSSIYQAKVMHHRLAPKKHSFWYNIYLFYLDLDELELLDRRLKLFSYRKFNLFSFRDRDHFQEELNATDKSLNDAKSDLKPTVKQQIITYIQSQGIAKPPHRIMLLTNLCVLGYNFNPVSFYFCFDENEQPLCAVAEISNTFREMKLFFFGSEDLTGNVFRQKAEKLFYVSPFIDLDTFFDFQLAIPTEKLDIKIDDYDRDGKRFFLSTLIGDRKVLSDQSLLRYFLKIPIIPLQVMWLIHWQAFKLWFKKIRFNRKNDDLHLQQNVLKRYKSNS